MLVRRRLKRDKILQEYYYAKEIAARSKIEAEALMKYVIDEFRNSGRRTGQDDIVQS